MIADQQFNSGFGTMHAFSVSAQRRWEVLDTGSESGLRSTHRVTANSSMLDQVDLRWIEA
ncbi:MAG: hypothetical protein ACRDYB_11270 [Acidimicrobiales bacterium]